MPLTDRKCLSCGHVGTDLIESVMTYAQSKIICPICGNEDYKRPDYQKIAHAKMGDSESWKAYNNGDLNVMDDTEKPYHGPTPFVDMGI